MPDPTTEEAANNNAETPRERPAFAPPPTIGRIVQFTESGEVHAALVCSVNDDESVNLCVYEHDGKNTFSRTNVRGSVAEAPKKEREQRWHWPARV